MFCIIHTATSDADSLLDFSFMGAQCHLVEAMENEARLMWLQQLCLPSSYYQPHEPGHQRGALYTLINSKSINKEEGKAA